MTTVALIPHQTSAAGGVESLTVDVMLQNDRLILNYSLTGDLEMIRIPPPGPTERKDKLWHHCCFEAFMGEGPAYEEINLSPSGAWAHYRFSDYRQALPNDPDIAAPEIDTERADGLFTLQAEIAPPTGFTTLGLSAVLEDRQGQLSYWALMHPSDKPDFHHPDARTLKLA